MFPTISGSAGASPAHVASINVCTDQYLLTLAGSGQIISVTRHATNPVRSAESAAATGITVNHGSAEEIAALAPDLVLADGFSESATVSLIRRLGIPVLVVNDATDFAGIVANVRLVAAALGAPDRGERTIKMMETMLLERAPAERPPVVAVLEAGGYTEGRGTLLDEAITRAGGVGLGRRLGLTGTSSLPLERLVAAPVDLLVRSIEADRSPSLGSALFRHPALRARFAQTAQLAIPSNLTDCASPASAALVPLIRQAIEALPASHEGARPE